MTLLERVAGCILRCALAIGSGEVRSMAASHLTALVSLLAPCLLALLLLRLAAVLDPDPDAAVPRVKAAAPLPLRFRHDGAFKILQVSNSRSLSESARAFSSVPAPR